MNPDPTFTGSLATDLSGLSELSDFEANQTPDPDPEDTFDILFDDTDASDPDDDGGDGDQDGRPVTEHPIMQFAMMPMAGLIGSHDGDDFPGRKVFRIGTSHPAVTRLGKMLIHRGGKRFYSVGAGPKFGVADRSACAAFQRAQGWSDDGADGYPGPRTWDLLVAGGGKDIPKGGGPLRSPVPGYRGTYPFGIKDRNYAAGWHTGQDYAAPKGTPIVAVVAGTVIRSDWGGAYGNWTQIKGHDGHVWVYCHQSRRAVHNGQQVKVGQVIGYVGATGHVTGPHLHLEKSKGSHWAYAQVVRPTW